MTRALAAAMLTAALVAPQGAAAEELEMSPEHFALQIGAGMYSPSSNAAFDSSFGGDNGPLVSLQFDVYAYRIPYVGPIGAGIHAGWAKYKGIALQQDGSPSSEGTRLTIFPIAPMALLRVDGLARHTPVPIVFTGRIGFDTIFYRSKKGSVTEGKGRTHGLRWAAQVALELNFASMARANSLDDDYGINSSFLYFEVSGSNANSRLNLGDKFAWVAGLGLTF